MKHISSIINTTAYFLFSCILVSCNNQSSNKMSLEETQKSSSELVDERVLITATLDSFNSTAARADYEGYFSYFTDDAVFIGTDATERWDKQQFMGWAKPYFDKKSTWNFTSVSRNIYFSSTGDLAWFDELLSTQMKICRGSGVVIKQNDKWKIQQYVLSMTFPNSKIDKVIKLKAAEEDSILKAISVK